MGRDATVALLNTAFTQIDSNGGDGAVVHVENALAVDNCTFAREAAEMADVACNELGTIMFTDQPLKQSACVVKPLRPPQSDDAGLAALQTLPRLADDWIARKRKARRRTPLIRAPCGQLQHCHLQMPALQTGRKPATQ